jgi:signal transduction histidine kinase
LVIPQFLPLPILAGMVTAAVLNIGILVIFSILLSHKIAGPLFNLVRHIRRMSLGQWRTTMKVRPGDDLVFIVRNINELSSNLVQFAETDLEIVNDVLTSKNLDSSSQQKLAQLQQRLESRVEQRTSLVKPHD